jgi:GTP cyclohydrolase I
VATQGKDIEMSQTIEDVVRVLLYYLHEDPDREGLRETPSRVAQAWKEWTRGYSQDPAEVLKCFEDGGEDYDQMVMVKNLPFFSHCEHHLAPFFGTATIAYLPNKRIVGLSKLGRVLDIFARRLQVQERLTTQIADALNKHLDPKGVGVLVKARHLCFDEQTELLTELGFKKFSDLIGTDYKVAQYWPSIGKIDFVRPDSWVALSYSGRMHQWKSKTIDLLVTPEHRMLIKSEWGFRKGRQFEFCPSKDVRGAVVLPRSGFYYGKSSETIQLGDEKVDIVNFCQFMGMFLSEGCIKVHGPNSFGTVITQRPKSKGYLPFKELFGVLPFQFQEEVSKGGTSRFRSRHRELGRYLAQFGKSYQKFIPPEVFHAPLKARLEFIRFYELGDGCSNNYNRCITTASPQMVDDLQAVLVLSGLANRATKRSILSTWNYQTSGTGDYWDIRIKLKRGRPKMESRSLSCDRSFVDYQGKVYCANVPSGALVVRRNGQIAITGNCMESRGLATQGHITITNALRGSFLEEKPRAEFLSIAQS